MNTQRLETVPTAGQTATVRAATRWGRLLSRGALGSVAVQAGGIGMTFASQVGLAHLLGAGAFGQYVYVVAWVNLLCVAGRMGLDLASLRFIAEYVSQQQPGRLKGFVRHSVAWVGLVSTLISVAGGGVMWYCFETLDHRLARAAWLGLILIPVLSLQGLFTAQLRAMKHSILCQLPRQVMSPSAIVTMTFLAAVVTGQATGATTALSLNVLTNVVLTVLTGLVAFRYLRSKFDGAAVATETRVWLSCSVSLLIVAIVQVVNLRLDVLMIGAMLGMKEAGIYAAAAQLAGLTTLGLVGVNMIAAPMIAELHAKRCRDAFQRYLTNASWMITLITIPLAIFLICAGQWLLGLFGSDFTAGYSALGILVIGHAVSALAGPVGFLAILTGHQREGAWILGIAAGMNMVLNVVLIPRYGLHGAAIATGVTTIVWNLAMLFFVARRLRVNPTVLSGPLEH